MFQPAAFTPPTSLALPTMPVRPAATGTALGGCPLGGSADVEVESRLA